MTEKIYEELQFRDDFMFCKILELRPDIAKELLELILGFAISKVVVRKQVPIEITSDGRGIRLDVYAVDDEDTVYDIEMQTTTKKELPKRSRYYQGMIDMNLIERGARFSELKRSYVIFICMKDPFKSGRAVYTFENVCLEDTSLRLGDESIKVFLNASTESEDISDDLREFFRLLKTGSGNTKLMRDIAAEVTNAIEHKKWRMEFMTLYMRDQENRDIGREEGLAEGHAKGLAEGLRNLMNNVGCDIDKAMDMLSVPIEERETIKSLV